MRRLAGVVRHPRSTMAELAARPTCLTTWLVLLMVTAACGLALVSTPVGRQALVDERVRVIESLGGRVDDAAYAALQAAPPLAAWATSGGRLLVNPAVTLLVAAALVALARFDGVAVRFAVALAVTVHATAVLVLQQVVAAPVHYVRESLTSPTTVAGLLPMLEEGSWAARLLGTIDLFGLWWVWLLGVGLGAAAGRPARRYWWRLGAAYFVVAATVAAGFALAGAEAY